MVDYFLHEYDLEDIRQRVRLCDSVDGIDVAIVLLRKMSVMISEVRGSDTQETRVASDVILSACRMLNHVKRGS